MPCYDSRDHNPPEGSPETVERLDRATRLLCYVMGTLLKGKDSNPYLDAELDVWWKQHQKDDARCQ